MVRRGWVAVVLCCALCSFAGAEKVNLYRIETVSGAEARELLTQGYRVLMDQGTCLLAEAGSGEAERMRGDGREVLLLDRDSGERDYFVLGLRPDSDLKLLAEAGEILHTEAGANWVVFRLWPGGPRERLYDARVFAAPLGHEALSLPAPAEPLSNRPAGPMHAVPLVQQITDSVTQADIDAYWNALVPPNPPGTGTRYSTSAGCTQYTSTVYSTFGGLGLGAQLQTYQSGYAPNVIGTLTGGVTPEKVYVVVGHLDDMPSSGYAPGADDNASGSVVVLEAAKALSCYAFKSTVKFIAVTGEEQGLYGSMAYAADAQARGEAIQGVLNMDMPGWQGDGLPASGENLDLDYDANSQPLGQFFAQCAADYGTGLPVDAFLCPSLNASDHYPFWQKGWRAVCGITDNEGYCGHGGSYPYYHTSNDTLANCGKRAFFYAVNKTTVAALAELAEPFKILLDKEAYACGDALQITVGDRDLNINPSTTQTVAVQVWSTTEPTPETVVLTEQGTNSRMFKGSLALALTAPANGDGALSVAGGDTLTARYMDVLDCNGSANVPYTATASFSTAPAFGGLASVSCPGDATCTLDLAWAAAGTCSGGASYSIYRSVDSGFTPGTSNRIAAGVAGTAYSDTDSLVSGTPTYYVVRATDPATGQEEANTVRRAGIPVGPYTTGTWTDDGGDTGTAKLSLEPTWTNAASGGHTALRCYATGTYTSNLCASVTTPSLVVGLGGGTLTFWSHYDLESGWDKGQVELSTNGGSTWTRLEITAYPANSTRTGDACGLPSGKLYFTGTDSTWRSYTATLPSGSAVLVRWRLSSDTSIENTGWWIDDISVTNVQIPGSCTTGPGGPPGEVAAGDSPGSAQGWSGKTIHTWPPHGRATEYRLYRGLRADLPGLLDGSVDSCLKYSGAAVSAAISDDPGTDVGGDPVPGRFYWYLVTGVNVAGEGTAGAASTRERVVDSSGACP